MNQNSEKDEQLKFYKEENKKLQMQVEELLAKLQQGFLDGGANQTME